MDSAAPRPRLCHLRKSPDFDGYGFNLHAEKSKAGQYIGKVDAGSPAEKAGLREGDRIVEVNGTNVGSENHSQVVARIKTVPDAVAFLVVDSEADKYFHEHKIVITGDMENIERFGGGAVEVEVLSEPPPVLAPQLETTASSAEQLIEIPIPKMVDSEAHHHDDDNGHHEDHHEANSNGEEIEAEVALAVLEAAVDTEEEHHQHANAAVDILTAVSDDAHSELREEHHEHRPRLCELKTWPDFGGYGFNLHANKGEPAQFIGKVDDGSPAEHSGLREGDRIIEVNGTNVEESSHQDVVSLVKATPGTVTLLVVDADADRHFKNLGVAIAGNLPFVERITCPDHNPTTAASLLEAPAEALSEVERIDKVEEPLVVNPPSYVEATEPEVQALAVTSHPHRARLCVIHSWKDGRGFGFSMQAQKGSGAKSGQFIGKVDKDTPADLAGLRSGDRIVEVNGSNVEKASHKEVVEKIKAVADVVELFVVDEEADKYFTGKGISVSSAMADCFDRKESSKVKLAAEAALVEAVVSSTPAAAEVAVIKEAAATENRVSVASDDKKADDAVPSSPTVVINGIEFAASAQEARKRMSKKKLVIDDKRSMKDKYELFQQM